MFRKRPKIACALFAVYAVCCLIFCFQPTIDFVDVDFVMFFTVLLSSAAIVFGVLGVWIAVVYPGVLKRLSSIPAHLAAEDVRLVSDLLLPLLLSTFTLLVLLILYPTSVVVDVSINSLDVRADHLAYIQSWKDRLLLSVLLIATGIEVVAVLSTLMPIGRAWSKVYVAYESGAMRQRVINPSQPKKKSQTEETTVEDIA